MGQAFALLPLDLVEPWGIDEEDAPGVELRPAPHLARLGLAVQGAGAEVPPPEQCVEGGGLADTDPAEGGDMDVALVQLLQHGLDLGIVLREGRPHLRRDARVMDQIAQALPGQIQVGVAPGSRPSPAPGSGRGGALGIGWVRRRLGRDQDQGIPGPGPG